MEFIETVRTLAGLADDAEAERAATAVLEALGGRIAGGNVLALAAELPAPLAAALRRGSDGEAHAGGTMELADKTKEILAERDEEERVDADPLDLVVAVMRGVATTVDRSVVDNLGEQLPADLTQLLIAEEQGDTSEVQTGG